MGTDKLLDILITLLIFWLGLITIAVLSVIVWAVVGWING